MKMVRACVFVQKMKRKYGARPIWVWDMIEDELNYDKGDGALLDEEEAAYIESLVVEGLS